MSTFFEGFASGISVELVSGSFVVELVGRKSGHVGTGQGQGAGLHVAPKGWTQRLPLYPWNSDHLTIHEGSREGRTGGTLTCERETRGQFSGRQASDPSFIHL